ncbi:MAG: hypothetical protein U0641_03720 [Anaerolineae bacterium]
MPYHRYDMSVSQPLVYQIRVDGTLAPDLSDYIRGMVITTETTGDEGSVTTLRGTCPDSSALLGVLHNLVNFGLPLISVECLGAPNGEPKAAADVEADASPFDQSAGDDGSSGSAPEVAEGVSGSTRLGGRRRLGAGAGAVVGGILGSAGGPEGGVAGAVVGGVAGHYIGRKAPAWRFHASSWMRMLNPFAWRVKTLAPPETAEALMAE